MASLARKSPASARPLVRWRSRVLGAGLSQTSSAQNAFDSAGLTPRTSFSTCCTQRRDLRALVSASGASCLKLSSPARSGRVRLAQTFAADGPRFCNPLQMGLEGVIAKKVDAPYRSARSDAWLKGSASSAMSS